MHQVGLSLLSQPNWHRSLTPCHPQHRLIFLEHRANASVVPAAISAATCPASALDAPLVFSAALVDGSAGFLQGGPRRIVNASSGQVSWQQRVAGLMHQPGDSQTATVTAQPGSEFSLNVTG